MRWTGRPRGLSLSLEEDPMQVLLLCLIAFAAIPDSVRDQYRFDLAKNFYPDEASFERDVGQLALMVDSVKTFQGRVTSTPQALASVFELLERLEPLWSKAYVYASLRHAVNTLDRGCLDRIRRVSANLASDLSFVDVEVSHLHPDTFEAWCAHEPSLKRFRWPIQRQIRRRAHVLPLPQEQLLASLSPVMEPWSQDLYQACLDRTQFPVVVSSRGESLHVRYAAMELSVDPDRTVRKAALQAYARAMESHRDLYAISLRHLVELKTTIARLRGFSDFYAQALFDDFLEPEVMDSILERVAERASLKKRYQELRRLRIARFAHLDTVFAWDMTLLPPGLEHPRWTVEESGEVLTRALGVLGDRYCQELASLLDPQQGRMDLVPGPHREPGAFAWGFYGAPWVFYSFSFEGFYDDLLTLAHESGHAIHYQLIYQAGVPPLESDGPGYLTESAAILNEFLLTDHLYRTAPTDELRAYFLEKLVSNAMGIFDIVSTTLQERDIYRAFSRGIDLNESLLDSISLSYGRRFSVFADVHPELFRDWMLVSHFYDSPMYYYNYVIAHLVALWCFQELQADPGFVHRYLSFLSAGFRGPGPQLLRTSLGLDIASPHLVEHALRQAEAWLLDLEGVWSSSP